MGVLPSFLSRFFLLYIFLMLYFSFRIEYRIRARFRFVSPALVVLNAIRLQRVMGFWFRVPHGHPYRHQCVP